MEELHEHTNSLKVQSKCIMKNTEVAFQEW